MPQQLAKTKRRKDAATIDDSPVALFFTLEQALRNERYETAHHADKQLRRLGVNVQFQGDRWRMPALTT